MSDLESTKPVDMLRIDLQQSLSQSTLDPRELSSFQRILLTTDGTVTEMLEAFLWEAMRIVKLYQELVSTEREIPYLELGAGSDILVRKILLRGKMSHKNYVYAESIIVPERLNPALRTGLLETGKSIGLLMLETRLETFREILSCRKEPTGEVAQYFDVEQDSSLVSRTYRVYAERKPIMLITEKFPETHFTDAPAR